MDASKDYIFASFAVILHWLIFYVVESLSHFYVLSLNSHWTAQKWASTSTWLHIYLGLWDPLELMQVVFKSILVRSNPCESKFSLEFLLLVLIESMWSILLGFLLPSLLDIVLGLLLELYVALWNGSIFKQLVCVYTSLSRIQGTSFASFSVFFDASRLAM